MNAYLISYKNLEGRQMTDLVLANNPQIAATGLQEDCEFLELKKMHGINNILTAKAINKDQEEEEVGGPLNGCEAI